MPAQPPQQITATVRTEPGSCPHGLSRQNSSLNPGCIAAPLDTKERALPTENELTLCQDTNSEHRKFKANILHNNLKQKKKRQAFSVGAITERCNNTALPTQGFHALPLILPLTGLFLHLQILPVPEHTSQHLAPVCTAWCELQDTDHGKRRRTPGESSNRLLLGNGDYRLSST